MLKSKFNSKEICIKYNFGCDKQCEKCILYVKNIYSLKSINSLELFSKYGGEAIIYEFKKNPNKLAKIFKNQSEQYLSRKIEAIVRLNKCRGKLKKDPFYEVVWTNQFLFDYDKNRIVGGIQNKVSGECLRKLANIKIAKDLGVDLKRVLELLISLAKLIHSLHEANIYIGDLSPNNILFDLKISKLYLIDVDSCGTDEFASKTFTIGYVDPLAIKKNKKNNKIEAVSTSKDSDWYSFAIIAFELLTKIHPFGGVYLHEEKIVNIYDRMEKKISLLGNYKIKIPEGTYKNWNWMNKELRLKFLEIFEGNFRGSILKELSSNAQELFEHSLVDNQNSKFRKPPTLYTLITKEQCRRIFNETSYLGTDNNIYMIGSNPKKYIELAKLQSLNIKVRDCYFINEENAYIISENNIYVFNLINGVIYSDCFSDNDEYLFLNGRLLYLKNNYVKRLKVVSNCVQVKSVMKSIFDKRYISFNQIYDKLSNSYIVVDKTNRFYTIRKREKPIRLNDNLFISLSKSAYDINHISCVHNNVFSYPTNGYIQSYNLKTGNSRSFKCEVVTEDSKLIRIKKGFVILNNDSAFRYST